MEIRPAELRTHVQFLQHDSLFSYLLSNEGKIRETKWFSKFKRIQNGQLQVYTGSVEKAAVMGALTLYLDFINLFLFLLRLFGARN